jgi:RNA-directed DNA polymerase
MMKASVVENGNHIKVDRGTPQGGVISPMLANIALTCLDEHLQSIEIRAFNQICRRFFIYARYETEAHQLKESAKQVLADKVGLNLSDDKTHITHISEGYDFPGFNIRKYNDKMLIKPSKESIKSIKGNLKEVFSTSQNATAGELIRIVQPISTGWGNNFRHVVCIQRFPRSGKPCA